MSDTYLELWEFENAPSKLRQGISAPQESGMIIFVLPGCAAEIVDFLVARWTLMGFPVVRQEREDGSIVLSGPVPPKSISPTP